MKTRRRAILDIASAAILWGVPTLFIRYFTVYLDRDTQNFWRYAAALAFLYLYAWRSGQRLFVPAPRVWPRILVAAAVLVVYQLCFTESLYHALPALVSLLIQLELIVAIALSCAFFPEERRVVRSPWFVVGAAAALSGAAGMVVFSRQFAAAATRPADWKSLAFAVTLVVSAAALWGSYSVCIKWCLRQMPPYAAFVNVATVVTLVFLFISLAAGRTASILRIPPGVTLLLAISGVGCIAIAHVFYTRAIHVLGVGVCNTVILASPIVAALASPVLFQERLTLLQAVSAAVLLLGAMAAVRANSAGATAPSAPSLPPPIE